MRRVDNKRVFQDLGGGWGALYTFGSTGRLASLWVRPTGPGSFRLPPTFRPNPLAALAVLAPPTGGRRMSPEPPDAALDALERSVRAYVKSTEREIAAIERRLDALWAVLRVVLEGSVR